MSLRYTSSSYIINVIDTHQSISSSTITINNLEQGLFDYKYFIYFIKTILIIYMFIVPVIVSNAFFLLNLATIDDGCIFLSS